MKQRIPLITRRNSLSGNPGDVYICYGLQHLLERFVPNPEFVLFDKFSDKDFKADLGSMRKAGFAIYAGTPQYNNYDDWCLWYDWNMYKEYIIPHGIDFYTVAGGSGAPVTETPVEFSKRCRSSKKTMDILKARKRITKLTTVRDPYCYQLLTDIGQDVSLLACTALWSSAWINTPIKDSHTVAFIPPNPKMLNPKLIGVSSETDVANWLVQFYTRLKKQLQKQGLDPIVVCHGAAEYKYFKHIDECFYSNDLNAMMKLYGTLHGVISARIHGAIPVAGMNKRALLLGIDSRSSAADVIGMPKMLFGNDDMSQVAKTYLESKVDYQPIIDSHAEAYLQLFDKHLGRCK